MADILPNNAPALSATSAAPVATPEPVITAPDTTVVTEPVVTVAPTATPVVPTPVAREPIGARISELARQRREADYRAARLEDLVTKQGESLTRALEALSRVSQQGTQPPSSSDFDSRPARDDFVTPEEYEVALVSWAGEQAATRAISEQTRQQEEARVARETAEAQARQASEEQARQTQAREAAESMRTAWETKREEAFTRYPDFAEVAENDKISISDPMAIVIMNSDDGAEIAYYLGKHPEEAAKIAALIVPGQVYPAGSPRAGLPIPDALRQAVAMGRLASKLGLDVSTTAVTEPVGNSLNAPATTATTTVPAAALTPNTPHTVVMAPNPVNPISGANANATSRAPADMSMDEYAAMRTPQNSRGPAAWSAFT